MTEQLYRRKITVDRIWYEPVELPAPQETRGDEPAVTDAARDVVNAYYAGDLHREIIALETALAASQQSSRLEREGLEVAFKPFADFMSATLFDKLSNETRLTAGSPMARRQLTVGDLRKLSDAILALLSPNMEPKP